MTDGLAHLPCGMLELSLTSGQLNFESTSIGRGTFGTVYPGTLTTHDGTVQHVAVKFVTCARNLAQCLAHEIQILSNLRHPNIIALLDSQTTTTRTMASSILVMPRAQCSIQSLLDARAVDRLDPRACAIQIGRALEFIHSRDLVHLDVTTMNIMMDAHNVHVLVDFGVCRARGFLCAANTLTNLACRAPECHMDNPANPKSDVWSLACVVAEMTGLVPFMFHTNISGPLSHKLVLADTFRPTCADGKLCVCPTLPRVQTSHVWKDYGVFLMVMHAWQADPTVRCTAGQAVTLVESCV